MNTTSYFDQILRDYESLEPGEGDTWNPVRNEIELGYRMVGLFGLAKALELCELPLSELRILDTGCGNGRSTRVYLDLGIRPEQLTGLDLRPGTISLAQSLNPAIRFQVYDGHAIPFLPNSFNWVQFLGVFSSIADHGHRAHIANEAIRQLEPGGYLYYLDLWRANGFAGGDILHPEQMFSGLEVIWATPFRSYKCFPPIRGALKILMHKRTPFEAFRAFLKPRERLARLRGPSHYLMLARKPV